MRLLTRAFFQSGRVFQLASSACHSAAAATLTLPEIRHNIVTRWQTFNITPAEVESGLLEWERDVADRLARPGAAVLIAGCGTGREVLAYLKLGCRVTGMDPARRALDIGRAMLAKHGLEVELIEGFIDETALSGEFDAVLFGWWTYCQIPERSRRVETLKRVAARLKPGGRIGLNFDILLRPRNAVIRLARAAGALAGSDWRLEPGDVVEWRHHGGDHFFGFSHAFVPAEIEDEAAAAGLQIVYRRDPPAHPVYVLEPAAR